MEINFTRTNGQLDNRIEELMDLAGDIRHPDMVREMIIAALKAGIENTGNEDRADLKLMNTTLKEMRFTSKIFSPYRHRKKVTVFGSARTGPDEQVYHMAKSFGKKLAEAGYMVITGAGGGIMQAANEGAGAENSFGVNIRLPFEQRANPVLVGNPRLIIYKYFFSRKVAFLKEADAIALFPGGFGTLDEAMETLTLLQTGKHNIIPLILIDEPGGTYWERWIAFFRKELLTEHYISDSDFQLFERVNSADEAVEKITRFYRRYHSIRYVEGKTVVRLAAPLGGGHAEKLRKDFSSLLVPGGSIELSGPLPEEADEPDIAGLQRLVLDFNRCDYGQLRKLIDTINDL
ncbi:MAG TPA: TIGR00730 family Rossman fold protein [Thermodesulfovibrionales bacterium]|nr:TIGR00730 family Rossman fold protein [Thermodesulfovibrionales bacterium]